MVKRLMLIIYRGTILHIAEREIRQGRQSHSNYRCSIDDQVPILDMNDVNSSEHNTYC